MDLKKAIREIENFPKEGINFKDITTLMQDGETFKYTIDAFINELKDKIENLGAQFKQYHSITDYPGMMFDLGIIPKRLRSA